MLPKKVRLTSFKFATKASNYFSTEIPTKPLQPRRKLRMRAKSIHYKEKDNSPVADQNRQLSPSNRTTKANAKVKGESRVKSTVSAKRKFIGASNSASKSFQRRRVTSENDTSKSMIVATNCKLTNELIDLNHKVSEKQKNYEKLMVLLFAEKKEKWFLQQKLARRDNTIKELEQKIEDMHESKFCKDLIRLDDSVPATDEGKSVRPSV